MLHGERGRAIIMNMVQRLDTPYMDINASAPLSFDICRVLHGTYRLFNYIHSTCYE